MNDIVRAADLRDQVFEALRQRIVTGTFRPGERLTETQISKDLGVSRTPAREALVMLTQAGLLQSSPRGFALPTFSPDDIRAVFEIRRQIEPFAVAKIVREVPRPDVLAAATRMRADIDAHRDYETYLLANSRIRAILFGLLTNQRLRHVIGMFEEQVHFIRLATLRDQSTRDISINGNLAVIDRLDQGDPEAAASEMRGLLRTAEEAALVAV